MSRRERPASGIAQVAPRPTAGATAPVVSAAAAPRHPWEEVFRGASPAQQEELLTLAERQGLIYSHQLPPPSNGRKAEPARTVLPRLLTGNTCQLEPILPAPLKNCPADLDDL